MFDSLNVWDSTFPDLYYQDVSNTQYLKLIAYLGYSRNNFQMMEIGFLDSLDLTSEVKFHYYAGTGFVTNNEIALGMLKSDFQKLGFPTIELNNKGSTILVIAAVKDLYEAKYFFDAEDRLVKFSFGNIYP